MNSNTTNQQPQEPTLLQRYFHSYNKYRPLEDAARKALSLIEQGRWKVQSETPFPTPAKPAQPTAKPRKFQLPPHLSPPKPTSSTPLHPRISTKNRRYLESLLHKYRIFQDALHKALPDAQPTAEQAFERICHYEQLLRNSPQRLPTTHQEEEFLEQEIYNIRLAHAIDEDERQLRLQARKFNCSLLRKNKYYDCLDDIRRKINSLKDPPSPKELPSSSKPVRTEGAESTRKTTLERRLNPIVRPERAKGRAYLDFSKQVGVESKEIFERERGKVAFVRQVVHHWWSGDPQRIPTVQSSLS